MRWYDIVSGGKDAFDVYSIGGIFAAIGILVLLFVIKPLMEKQGPKLAERYPAMGCLLALVVLAFVVYILVSNFPGL